MTACSSSILQSNSDHKVCLLIFFGLYGCSYSFIRFIRNRKENDELYLGDEGDIVVFRVANYICNLSMTVSIASVLLVPFSIFSNEFLLIYPHSFYMQWLNESLIRSLWNYVFLLNNLCLFVLLPFAYFFVESQGIIGLRSGIVTRVCETVSVCIFVVIVVTNLFRLGFYFCFGDHMEFQFFSCKSFLLNYAMYDQGAMGWTPPCNFYGIDTCGDHGTVRGLDG
ncbi:unnamed protein product [Soboliphyme baturini]|uniref:Uncharacterized protein n=1 Tax=Soboliphyme baturini TaxID=241478 RepID=A0A183IFU3_9BILA|nr:unnamed protein product [Soboliphyme baturini]